MFAKTRFFILCGMTGAAAAFGDQICTNDPASKFLATSADDSVQLMQVGMQAANADDPVEMETFSASSAEARVVLYVTMAMTSQHISFLDCYPYVIGKRLGTADVILHVSEKMESNEKTRLHLENLLGNWTSGKKTIHYFSGAGHPNGTMKAMDDAFSNGWFDGYDWMIKMTPDVLIYDEAPLLSFLDNPKVSAVVSKCGGNHPGGTWAHNVHTDFFAVRPRRLARDAWKSYDNFDTAAAHATSVLQPILMSKSYVALTPKSKWGCSLHGGGILQSKEYCYQTVKHPLWNYRLSQAANKTVDEEDDIWQEGWVTSGWS